MNDLSYEQRKAELVEAINVAFDGVSREGGVSLHESSVIDNYGDEEERAHARSLDTEKRWQDVPDADVSWAFADGAFLIFLDEIGFRYYVPVCMVWSLKYMDRDELPEFPDDNGNVLECLLDSLNPHLRAEQHKRFSVFTFEESKAVSSFLKFTEEWEDAWQAEADELLEQTLLSDGYQPDEIATRMKLRSSDPNISRRSLAEYWGKFLTQSVIMLAVLLTSTFGAHGQSKIVASPGKAATVKKPSNVEEYFWRQWYMGETLKLFSDGRFQQINYSDVIDIKTGATAIVLHGHYTRKNGLLVLTPEYWVRDVEAKSKYANQRTQWTDGPLRLLTVRWGQRHYLISEGKQELDFCNAINLGLEPRPAKPREGSWFFLRVGDEKRLITGSPELPQKWRPYVLDAPVSGVVKSVQKDSSLIVNIGRLDGLKVGMVLTDEQGTGTNPEINKFTVIAVRNRQATIKGEYYWAQNLRVGDEVFSRPGFLAPGQPFWQPLGDSVYILD